MYQELSNESTLKTISISKLPLTALLATPRRFGGAIGATVNRLEFNSDPYRKYYIGLNAPRKKIFNYNLKNDSQYSWLVQFYPLLQVPTTQKPGCKKCRDSFAFTSKTQIADLLQQGIRPDF